VAFFQQAIERVKALPGVRDAALVDYLPFSGNDRTLTFNIEGRPPFPRGEEPEARLRLASPDYFRTMNTPALARTPFSGERHGAKSAGASHQRNIRTEILPQ
jgi:hypothetical protein